MKPMKPVVPGTDRQISITASGTPAGDRTHNTEQPHEGVRMLTTESTTHRTTTAGTHDTASRLCEAWAWLEAQRQNAPEGADVWDIRWQAQKSTTYLTDLLHTLRAGQYRLSPLQLHGQGNERKAVWGAQDALVLKWVALSMEDRLPLHPACEHIKGHGGGKQSIHRLHALLTGNTGTPDATDTTASKKTADYAWVCRTDIRGYYRHINKQTLLNQVRQHVQDPVLVGLIHQYLHYTVEDGGTFHTPESGISRGCPLSPLMGALHLYDMDEHFSNQKHIHYARYMDDIIILAKTRWSLRKHTKRLMQWFSEYGFEAHPDKTQIGRTRKGFDWMGAWLTHEGVTDIAPRAKANHREKVRRLYERLARVPVWLRHRRQQQVHARVSAYRKRWNIWAQWITMIGACQLFCASSCFAEKIAVTGLPTLISPTAMPGDNLGSGTMTTKTVRTTKTNTGGSNYGLDEYLGGQKYSRIVNGLGAIYVFKQCPIGFHITGIKITAPNTGTATGVPPAANDNYSRAENGGWLPIGTATTVTFTWSGYWVLLSPATNIMKDCPSYEIDPGLARTISHANPTYTYPNGSGGVSGRGGNSDGWDAATLDVGPAVPGPPPTTPVVCSLSVSPTTVMLDDGSGSGTINATTLSAADNVTIVGISSGAMTVTPTCTGGSGPPSIHGAVKWTTVKNWTAKFYGGIPSDGDASAPLFLSTSPRAINEKFTNTGAWCDTMQPTYRDCDTFKLTNGVPKMLYPALLRDTTANKPTSGTKTISGTIAVVVE